MSKAPSLVGTMAQSGPRHVLAALRKARGMTLVDAGRAASISKSELSRLERGERALDQRQLAALAVAYDTEYRELARLLGMDAESTAAPAIADLKPSAPASARSGVTIPPGADACRQWATALAADLGTATYVEEVSCPFSMAPPGTLVVADRHALARAGDFVLVTRNRRPSVGTLDLGAQAKVVVRFRGNPPAATLGSMHKVLMMLLP